MKTKAPQIFRGTERSNSQQPLLTVDAYRGMSFDRIGPDLVLSRDKNGDPITLFSYSIWDFPEHVQSSLDRSTFEFSAPSGNPHHYENEYFTKVILLTCLYSPHLKTGQPMRLGSLHAVHNALDSITSHAKKIKTPAVKIFNSTELMSKYLSGCTASKLKPLKTICRAIANHNLTSHGITISGTVFAQVNNAVRNYNLLREENQTSIIPSRILAKRYIQYTTHIKDYLNNEEGIQALISTACEDRTYARCRPRDKSIKSPHTDFNQAIQQHGLTTIAEKYLWQGLPSVTGYLQTVQYCAKNIIHMFTLMREHEIFNLRADCIIPINGWKNDGLYLVSTSTKLLARSQTLHWITTNAIIKPIKALESISRLIAQNNTDRKFEPWLFLSISYLRLSGKTPESREVSKIAFSNRLPAIYITERDIIELESIDPQRNWRADKKFKVGAAWKDRSHQFRRSIAVFSGQSGLISIQSLKRLLHHLTEAMSIHYQKGCSAQNYNFSLIQPELTKEIREAKVDADNALYIRDIIYSKETLGGFHGSRVTQQSIEKIWITDDTEEFDRKTRLGRQSYESTPFGGCASNDRCDKRAHSDFTSCGGCKNCCVIPSRIDATIEELTWDLMQIPVGTVEYRAEEQNLRDFKLLREITVKRT